LADSPTLRDQTITDRKALAKALAALGTGDVLLVTRLDRLARSTRDLLNILDGISKAGAKFRSLADAWADTTTPHGELMITILAGLATFEPLDKGPDYRRQEASTGPLSEVR
jgi:DNA invertase Pin-like site-specific DNA recombinase